MIHNATILKQVLETKTLDSIVWSNPSSIPDRNTFWPDFTYLVAKLWITGGPFPWEPEG
jgi:hypothetical protein